MESLLKKKTNFVLKPSLEHRAFTQIAMTLWSRDCIRDYIKNAYYDSKTYPTIEDIWPKVEVVVLEESSKLPLPAILKQKLRGFIVSVGLQILLWIDFHQHDNSFVTELPATLVWTSFGTIDNTKTAIALLKDESLVVNDRFQLACIYCLEDEIRDLWETFDLYGRAHTLRTTPDLHIATFWTQYLEQKFDKRIYEYELTPCEYAFKYAAKYGYEAATRYFFEKLSPEDKVNFIPKITRRVASMLTTEYPGDELGGERCAGVLLFLLSTMDADQQADIFTSHIYEVLRSLLFWPWQSLFLETAKSNWNHLSKNYYSNLLYYIVDMMDYKLFGEFWQQTPETYKRFVTDGDGFGCLLLDLYYNEDDKNIQLILNDSSISARENLIFSRVGLEICESLISRKQWDSVEYLIQECISSQEELIKFKDNFRKYITKRDNFEEECQWDKFFQVVDNCIPGHNKRKPV